MALSDDFNNKTSDELGGELWELLSLRRLPKEEVTQKALALIEAGADINFSRASNCTTPLIEAAAKGYTDVVHALVNKGAELDKTTLDGWSAVMGAIYFCRTDVAAFLINKSAALDARGLPWVDNAGSLNEGATALSLAKYRGLTDIIKLIEEKTAAKKPTVLKPPKA